MMSMNTRSLNGAFAVEEKKKKKKGQGKMKRKGEKK
jgi:hypothetical protein